MRPSLATLEEAVKELGVPKGSLRAAAEEHGYLVRMGRAVRIDRNDFEALVQKCKEQGRTDAPAPSGKTRQRELAPKESQTASRAWEAVQRLKNVKRDKTRGRAEKAESTD